MKRAYERAVEHHGAGRLREAIGEYRAAVVEEPERARVFTNFALALRAHGDDAEALIQALQGVTLAPEDAYVVGNAADFLVSAERNDSAIAMCEAYLQRDDIPADARVDLVFTPYAQALLATDRDDEALVAADKACQGKHNNANAFVTYAQALGVHYRVDEARAFLDRAEAFAPGHETIADVRSTIDALDAEMTAIADRAYDDAVKYGSCDHWCVLGGILHRMGRFVEARASFAEAIARDPESADAWWGHGIALQALGDRFPEDVLSLKYASELHRQQREASMEPRGLSAGNVKKRA